jgi:hypothetical protein
MFIKQINYNSAIRYATNCSVVAKEILDVLWPARIVEMAAKTRRPRKMMSQLRPIFVTLKFKLKDYSMEVGNNLCSYMNSKR